MRSPFKGLNYFLYSRIHLVFISGCQRRTLHHQFLKCLRWIFPLWNQFWGDHVNFELYEHPMISWCLWNMFYVLNKEHG